MRSGNQGNMFPYLMLFTYLGGKIKCIFKYSSILCFRVTPFQQQKRPRIIPVSHSIYNTLFYAHSSNPCDISSPKVKQTSFFQCIQKKDLHQDHFDPSHALLLYSDIPLFSSFYLQCKKQNVTAYYLDADTSPQAVEAA